MQLHTTSRRASKTKTVQNKPLHTLVEKEQHWKHQTALLLVAVNYTLQLHTHKRNIRPKYAVRDASGTDWGYFGAGD